MLVCIDCKKVLMEIPVFNDGKDDQFPPAFLFCPSEKCKRHGLYTAAFLNEKEDKESSDKKV